jgi:multidrug efflux system membrane fusion protein
MPGKRVCDGIIQPPYNHEVNLSQRSPKRMMEHESRTTTAPTYEPPTGHDDHPRRPDRAGSQSKHRVWVWLLVLVIFGLLFWWVIRQSGGSSTQTSGSGGRRMPAGGAVTATTATVSKGDLGVYLSAIGTVTPVYTVSIVSQVTGEVVAVHYREGQVVQKGDPLIDIYSKPFEATLKQAEGTLEKDRHLLEQQQMDLARYQTALTRNAIAKQQVEDQDKIVLQQQGTVKADEGAVDYDRVQVAFCHITSPITGRVGLRLVDPGNVVTANSSTALAVVTQIQPITVVFTISEDNLQKVLSQLHKLQTLKVEALDRAQLKTLAEGKLVTTDNLIDTTTGTVKLRALFENKNNALFPNQFVNTRLQVDTLHNVNLVVSSAIQHNGTQAFVWVVQDGVAQIRNITTGASDSNLTQVEGVNPGEVVADSSFEKLQNGVKVVPVQQIPGEPNGRPPAILNPAIQPPTPNTSPNSNANPHGSPKKGSAKN